jgi:hypothetical protein
VSGKSAGGGEGTVGLTQPCCEECEEKGFQSSIELQGILFQPFFAARRREASRGSFALLTI